MPLEKWGEFRSSTAEKEEETESEDESKKKEGNKERGAGWDAGVGRRERLVSGGGRDGYAHIFELGAGPAFFFGTGVALDDVAEFPNTSILLS